MPSAFSHSNDGTNARERFYQLDAVPDPVRTAARQGRGHYNAATGRTLFHQSAMPMGEHLGKDMERVPARYYLWLETQSWFPTASNGWEHIRDYIDRHRQDIETRAEKEAAHHISTFDPLSPAPLNAPMMPIPIGEPPPLPWPKDITIGLKREHGFTCGPFALMAATGLPPEAILSVLINLNPPTAAG
jgi:hypothetical protein